MGTLTEAQSPGVALGATVPQITDAWKEAQELATALTSALNDGASLTAGSYQHIKLTQIVRRINDITGAARSSWAVDAQPESKKLMKEVEDMMKEVASTKRDVTTIKSDVKTVGNDMKDLKAMFVRFMTEREETRGGDAAVGRGGAAVAAVVAGDGGVAGVPPPPTPARDGPLLALQIDSYIHLTALTTLDISLMRPPSPALAAQIVEGTLPWSYWWAEIQCKKGLGQWQAKLRALGCAQNTANAQTMGTLGAFLFQHLDGNGRIVAGHLQAAPPA